MPVGSPQGLIDNDATFGIFDPGGLQFQGLQIRCPPGAMTHKVRFETAGICGSYRISLSMFLNGLDVNAGSDINAFGFRRLHQQLNHVGVKRPQRTLNDFQNYRTLVA